MKHPQTLFYSMNYYIDIWIRDQGAGRKWRHQLSRRERREHSGTDLKKILCSYLEEYMPEGCHLEQVYENHFHARYKITQGSLRQGIYYVMAFAFKDSSTGNFV